MWGLRCDQIEIHDEYQFLIVNNVILSWEYYMWGLGRDQIEIHDEYQFLIT
jgi:hypothetical protein